MNQITNINQNNKEVNFKYTSINKKSKNRLQLKYIILILSIFLLTIYFLFHESYQANKLEQTQNEKYLQNELNWSVIKNKQIKTDDYEIVERIPMNKNLDCFTQGFKFYNEKQNNLLMSCGEYKYSRLIIMDLKTKVLQNNKSLHPKYFAEGSHNIRYKRDGKIVHEIFQLTYQERTIFVYDYDTLEIKRQEIIPKEIRQGWGLLAITLDDSDDQKFLITDGTSQIFQMNPSNLQIEKQTQVYQMVNNKKQYLSYLNDMELINGYLYINLFTYPTIIKVDYKTGEVVKRYNLSQVSKEIQNTLFFRNNFNDIREYCLNGIAHNKETGKTYITGKKWPIVYQIELQ